MGELLGFEGLLVFSVRFFAAFFRCERGRVVSTGLARTFRLYRHFRAGLSHAAASRLDFGDSIPVDYQPGAAFHVPRRLKPRFYLSRNAALKCCFTQNRFFLWACKTGPDFLAGLKGEPLIRGRVFS